VFGLFLFFTKCSLGMECYEENEKRFKENIEYLNFLRAQYMNTTQFDLNTAPLQPLGDNLDTEVYETFERDPAKYIYYQNAIESALKDLIPENEVECRKAVVMIVGAGRGIFIR
jgi:type II protein arginine methyltransferase